MSNLSDEAPLSSQSPPSSAWLDQTTVPAIRVRHLWHRFGKLDVLVNTDAGRTYLAKRHGVDDDVLEALGHFGLSSIANVLAAVKTAFANAAGGALSVGGYNVNYATTATLMSQQTFTAYGSGVVAVIQTWKFTADGSIGGARPGQL